MLHDDSWGRVCNNWCVNLIFACRKVTTILPYDRVDRFRLNDAITERHKYFVKITVSTLKFRNTVRIRTGRVWTRPENGKRTIGWFYQRFLPQLSHFLFSLQFYRRRGFFFSTFFCSICKEREETAHWSNKQVRGK